MPNTTDGWQPINTLYEWLKEIEDNDACYEVAEIRESGTLVWTMATSVRRTSPWPHYPNPPTHWRLIHV